MNDPYINFKQLQYIFLGNKMKIKSWQYPVFISYYHNLFNTRRYTANADANAEANCYCYFASAKFCRDKDCLSFFFFKKKSFRYFSYFKNLQDYKICICKFSRVCHFILRAVHCFSLASFP